MKQKITKNSILKNVLEIKGAEKILAKHGVPCVSCPYAKMEMDELKIGDICKTYGIDLSKLVKDLNSLQ